MEHDVFPVGLVLAGRCCLVVGSGEDAERRARALVAAGARVRVLSERATDALGRLSEDGSVVLAQRPFHETDLDGVWLAVYSDTDPAAAARVAAAAEARRVFFCAVDLPSVSSYAHLAIAKAGPVTVAISTSGRAPSLARRLRDELARVFDEAKLATFAEALARLRERTAPALRRAVLGDAVRALRFDGKLSIPDDGAGPTSRNPP